MNGLFPETRSEVGKGSNGPPTRIDSQRPEVSQQQHAILTVQSTLPATRSRYVILKERTVCVRTVPLTTQDYRDGITTCPLSTLLLEERQLTRDGSTQLSEVTQNLRRETHHSSNSEIYSTQCAVQSDGSVNRQNLSRKVFVLHRWFLLQFIMGSPNRLCHCRWIQSWDKNKKDGTTQLLFFTSYVRSATWLHWKIWESVGAIGLHRGRLGQCGFAEINRSAE